ncbi:RsmB/NOP family class I SAM-dependent RNA methyltransferase [Algicella marina]|uniref:RsmB/NOP family class I SAM-dependent RNA methyltransferase n=1 Tax=Algicella marina TaxID=2683284 RepID=UPI0024E01138|nr:transcription antitermination factor NusB [Algicella marina]
MSAGLAPRKAAERLLAGVLRDRRMLTELLDAPDSPLQDLEGPERARAQSLATGVLRNLGSLDAVIGQHVERMPPLGAMIALRIAAFEGLVEGVPPHAAVSSAVNLLGGNNKRLSGLVNAVARKVVAEAAAVPPPVLPEWLATALRKAYGKAAVDGIAAAHATTPPLDLTPRDATEAEALAAELGAELLPTGSLRLTRPGQVSELPGYDEGRWWVQDAAAAIPARLLGDITGQRVLDLCAAPGGKTMQLAAAGAEVTALDISQARCERISQNLARTSLRAEIVVADARQWQPQAPFDAILLDAPCSATGTIRRHPDLPHARPSPDLRPLLALQADLIDRALGWLKHGGILLYCTCSLLPKEGERQVSQALERHDGLALVPVTPGSGIEPAFINASGSLRLRPDFWPERGGMDGFFATSLRKP